MDKYKAYVCGKHGLEPEWFEDYVAFLRGLQAELSNKHETATVAAAHACYSHGIATVVGAPNLVRGRSHSGNVAASELAQLDRLDILSSDYVPASLLMAATQVGTLWDDLPRGIATVTQTPARAVGLDDRGRLAIGPRGDIIRFSIHSLV